MISSLNMSSGFPRILLIDHTRIGDGTATGELKANLFHNWPADRLLQLYAIGDDAYGVYDAKPGSNAFKARRLPDIGEFWRQAVEYDADIIFYRPVPGTQNFHDLAMQFIESSDLPLALWIMDDWPTALAVSDQPAFKKLNQEWIKLIRRSACRFSISDAMSTAFSKRYGVNFTPLANGVDPTEWRVPVDKRNGGLKIRYAGSLAENMTLSSVLLIARAVDKLAEKGCNIRFEIKTSRLWRRQTKHEFKNFKNTVVYARNLTAAKYREWLSQSDITVIAYNFDKTSQEYTRFSMANKLPEVLACGAPLLAVGPQDAATMSFLEKIDCGLRINASDADAIADAIYTLVSSPEKRRTMAHKSRAYAFENMNIHAQRETLKTTLAPIAEHNSARSISMPRALHFEVDESTVIYDLLKEKRGNQHVMLDVGAHLGSAAAPFQRLGWTIHCFEPDQENRQKLIDELGTAPNVAIDPRAIGETVHQEAQFYRSNESSGISSLHPFRDTHEEAEKVEVTTLSNVVRERQYERIGFLKIDAEGTDFAVLKGVPWESIKPSVIECEFEDKKVRSASDHWNEMASFLINKGYTVYVSEWHPIKRYGIAHDWRRLFRYPADNVTNGAWGNLLAFAHDPGEEVIRSAFARALTRRFDLDENDESENASQAFPQSSMPPRRGMLAIQRARLIHRLSKNNPRLYAALRKLKNAMPFLESRR